MARKTVLRRKDIIISSSLAVLDITAVVLFQLLLISPVTSRAREERTRLADVVKQLEENNKKRRVLQDVAQQNEKLGSQLAVFDKRVSTKSGTVALFAEVLGIAGQNSLKILSTQPMEPVAVGQGFLRSAYEINLQGNYSDVGQFFSSIESRASFIDVPKADFTGIADGSVKVKFILNLYAVAEQAAEEAKPAPPKASTASAAPPRG